MDDSFTKLSQELTVLNDFVKQRAIDAKKESSNPEYIRMVSPPYEGELIAATRIIVLIQRIYQDEQA